jgi:hypothetical protein
LSLTPEDADELKLALEVRLHSLRFELTATDHKEYRNFLRHRIERLESLSERLTAEGAEELPASP